MSKPNGAGASGDQQGGAVPAAAGPTPLTVGGFSSQHPAGANFAFGDGSVRFLEETIALKVYSQLGHRADGQLLDDRY